MKFTLIKDVKNDRLMRPLLGGLLFFILFFLVADIFVKNGQLGLTPSLLSATLYGNEAEYSDPITQNFFLELVHSDIFFMMMTLLSLAAVYARLCQNAKLRVFSINITMLVALLSLLFLLMAYYASEIFVLPYIVSFYAWHISAFFMASASLFYLFFPQKSDL